MQKRESGTTRRLRKQLGENFGQPDNSKFENIDLESICEGDIRSLGLAVLQRSREEAELNEFKESDVTKEEAV